MFIPLFIQMAHQSPCLLISINIKLIKFIGSQYLVIYRNCSRFKASK